MARVLVVGVSGDDTSVAACEWVVEHVYRPGDELHLIHIVPRSDPSQGPIVAPGDLVARRNPSEYDHAVEGAEKFIAQRLLPVLAVLTTDPVVHLIKSEMDTDSIGGVLCRKADGLGAALLLVSSHTKSKVTEFFVGSVCSYCTHNSKVPVIVHKRSL
uniref:UspA domain-containing protein n=1 Tax=Tetraselmis chuii TaxID=63592 RepID=A0A7S1SI72_9CHLO|mmetsp:Transcript_13641/g.24205  ORF Transcript_13641/g.24205 Transcript_13641/m.24205 type:complete len:158 (+) Transcript_13641:363-836(+)